MCKCKCMCAVWLFSSKCKWLKKQSGCTSCTFSARMHMFGTTATAAAHAACWLHRCAFCAEYVRSVINALSSRGEGARISCEMRAFSLLHQAAHHTTFTSPHACWSLPQIQAKASNHVAWANYHPVEHKDAKTIANVTLGRVLQKRFELHCIEIHTKDKA